MSPAASRRRGRPKIEGDLQISRDVLLRAALEAFAAYGYDGMSIRDLARRLGISHGLLNLRFGSKQRLWEACIDFGLVQFQRRMTNLPSEGSIEERFKMAVVEVLHAIGAEPAMLRITNNEGALNSERLDRITETIVADRYSRLEGVIREGVEAGIFREMPAQLVTMMVAHGGGVLFGLKPLATKLGLLVSGDDRELQEHASEIADMMYRAIQR